MMQSETKPNHWDGYPQGLPKKHSSIYWVKVINPHFKNEVGSEIHHGGVCRKKDMCAILFTSK